MSYWQKINPGGAASDLVTVFRDAGPKRWPIALVSALITVGVFSIMADESWKKPRALPVVTYITSWPMDRTDAETRAFIEENQKRKEAEEAAAAKADADAREVWATLGKVSGMDVEKMKQQAEAERAAEAAKKKAETDALLKQVKVEPVAQ